MFGWFFLGTAGTLWALWWGALPFSGPQPLRANVEVNGQNVRLSSWEFRGEMPASIGALTQDWERQGWMPFGGNQNLAPLLLGMSSEDPAGWDALGNGCRVVLFKRRDDFRLLALLRRKGGNLRAITADVPGAALEPPAEVLPEDVATSRVVRTQGMEVRMEQRGRPAGDVESLARRARLQGFSWNHWEDRGEDHLFLARRGSVSYLVTLSPANQGSIATWTCIR
jgi:hypothetical protein